MYNISRGRCLLRKLLKSRNMTQTEFALRSGWSQRMVSYYCRDERKMSVEAMYVASLILEVNMADLYEWILEQ
ncbi:transcriptional regulator with XRE-family HTH domain [Paenibacillus sp. SORGH_AS306]|uniref:helix-turn-helix domain-containing protein n=1 Tax=unclassified Paenibacillus TaxID=185978 RepID=UPI00278AFBC8|nr:MULTISPECIES: helix-turn-helix transcriptional regulator [unclassified Paenibacillus]MDQ1233367.1 transcriptional regulator with XRE-family HTH domain [Paenibacillus sp. SORGH_AS_0306]MDR6110408.1 transcriptional regulator with XRE-family HTH domain [Paenibacillus sp. SORGH_AS_0338]